VQRCRKCKAGFRIYCEKKLRGANTFARHLFALTNQKKIVATDYKQYNSI